MRFFFISYDETSQTSWVKRAPSFYYITGGSSLELPLGPAPSLLTPAASLPTPLFDPLAPLLGN